MNDNNTLHDAVKEVAHREIGNSLTPPVRHRVVNAIVAAVEVLRHDLSHDLRDVLISSEVMAVVEAVGRTETGVMASPQLKYDRLREPCVKLADAIRSGKRCGGGLHPATVELLRRLKSNNFEIRTPLGCEGRADKMLDAWEAWCDAGHPDLPTGKEGGES